MPDFIRGLVSSVWQYEQGLTPLFVVLISLLADWRGIGFALSAVGMISLLLGIFFLVRFKDSRSLD